MESKTSLKKLPAGSEDRRTFIIDECRKLSAKQVHIENLQERLIQNREEIINYLDSEFHNLKCDWVKDLYDIPTTIIRQELPFDRSKANVVNVKLQHNVMSLEIKVGNTMFSTGFFTIDELEDYFIINSK